MHDTKVAYGETICHDLGLKSTGQVQGHWRKF